MNRLRYNDLLVTDFDGSAVTWCGTAAPIVYNEKTERYFLLHDEEPENEQECCWFPKSDVEAYRKEGRITPLPGPPVPAFPQATIVYVVKALVEAADHQFDLNSGWRQLGNEIWVSCLATEAADQLLNSWGKALIRKSSERIERYVSDSRRDPFLLDEGERYADMAVCAATEYPLRARAYRRWAVALWLSGNQEGVENLYDPFVASEFPEWSREAFYADMYSLIAQFETMPRRVRTPAVDYSLAASPDLAVNPLFSRLEEAWAEIAGIADEQQRDVRRKEIAEEQSQYLVMDADQLAAVAAETVASEPYTVSPEHIPLFATVPAFYIPEVLFSVRPAEGKIELSSMRFDEALERDMARSVGVGRFGECLLHLTQAA